MAKHSPKIQLGSFFPKILKIIKKVGKLENADLETMIKKEVLEMGV